MSPFLKAKLSLFALCLLAVAGSQLYFKGLDDGVSAGIASIDDQAFEAYTHFAKQMKPEAHKAAHKAPKSDAASIWAALEPKQRSGE